MMTPAQQLEAIGHARVLVVLKPSATKKQDGQTRLALSETISLQQEVARDLRKHFRSFRNSRFSQIAREVAAQPMFKSIEYKVDERAKSIGSVGPQSPVQYFPNLGIMLGTVDRAGLAALQKNGKAVDTVFSPPDLSLIRPFEDDSAALAGPPEGTSWSLTRLKIPELWQQNLTGKDILIGHVDTGADGTHPALANAIDAFAYFDDTGRQVANSPIRDTQFHGSHTAGILVGKPFNNLTFGCAPDAKLAVAAVIEGGDVTARVVAGLDWCVGQNVHLINVSLGLREFQPQFSTILQLLRQRNILPIVAIGNEGAQTSRTPGNLPEALSVGAMDESDQIWMNSSSQQMAEDPRRNVPVLIGPGAGIWSSVPTGQLRSLSGTSMATPHISGLAALLLQHRPDVAIADLEKAIITSCKRPDGISTLRGNKGVPNAVDALAAMP